MPIKRADRCSFFGVCLNYDRHSVLCNEGLGVYEDGSHCRRKGVVAAVLEERRGKDGV